MRQLFEELKRRKVFRVAAVYVIVGWLVLQVVDVFMEFMPLPEWTNRLVFLLLAVGFPVALLLAWALELTPQGLRLEISGKAEIKSDRSRRFDLLIFGALAAIFGFVAWNHDWSGTSAPVSGDIRSLVVLPLDNLINDPEQAYFRPGNARSADHRAIKNRSNSRYFANFGDEVQEFEQVCTGNR